MFRALRHRNFALFVVGQGISLIGTWMQQVAMGWLVYRLTNSSFLLGLVSFSTQIPTFLFSSLGGVLADRWDRKRILTITQILSLLQAAALAALTLSGRVEVWHVIVLGVLLGLINALDIPTRQSFLIEMVENKEDLGNAIALNASLVNAARLIGPSLAGVLISLSGEGMCFLLNAISYVAVVAALFFMKVNSPAASASELNVWEGWKEGVRYAWSSIPIRMILILLSLVSMMGMSYMVLMPVFVTQIFKGGPRLLGFLTAASGLGALGGTFYLANRKSVVGLGRLISFSAALLGVGMISFAYTRWVWLSSLFIIITGFSLIVEMAASNTIIQTIVEDDKRGRVMSLFSMAFMGMAPLGSLWSGSLAHYLGAPSAVFLSGVLCVAGALLFLKQLPAIRAVTRPIYERMGILRNAPLNH